MKKLIWAAAILALALIITIAAIFLVNRKPAETTWQAQYDLGMRYLSEGNYEQAILAFQAAIEIDPREPMAYVMLSSCYSAIGEYDLAEEVLQQGLEATDGNVEIQAQLEALAEVQPAGTEPPAVSETPAQPSLAGAYIMLELRPASVYAAQFQTDGTVSAWHLETGTPQQFRYEQNAEGFVLYDFGEPIRFLYDGAAYCSEQQYEMTAPESNETFSDYCRAYFAGAEAEYQRLSEQGQQTEDPYRTIVENALAQYGRLNFVNDGEQYYAAGVIWLGLLDFDGNGTDELAMVHGSGDLALEIWTLENGAPLQVYSGGYNWTPSNTWMEGRGYFHLIELDGRIYVPVYDDLFQASGELMVHLWGLSGGAVTEQLSYRYEDFNGHTLPDGRDYTKIVDFQYFVAARSDSYETEYASISALQMEMDAMLAYFGI